MFWFKITFKSSQPIHPSKRRPWIYIVCWTTQCHAAAVKIWVNFYLIIKKQLTKSWSLKETSIFSDGEYLGWMDWIRHWKLFTLNYSKLIWNRQRCGSTNLLMQWWKMLSHDGSRLVGMCFNTSAIPLCINCSDFCYFCQTYDLIYIVDNRITVFSCKFGEKHNYGR
jgi:hypothetical protein